MKDDYKEEMEESPYNKKGREEAFMKGDDDSEFEEADESESEEE